MPRVCMIHVVYHVRGALDEGYDEVMEELVARAPQIFMDPVPQVETKEQVLLTAATDAQGSSGQRNDAGMLGKAA